MTVQIDETGQYDGILKMADCKIRKHAPDLRQRGHVLDEPGFDGDGPFGYRLSANGIRPAGRNYYAFVAQARSFNGPVPLTSCGKIIFDAYL
jgi:hypothetical protein